MRLRNQSDRNKMLSEETKKKLYYSMLEAHGVQFRDMRCPVCHFVVAKVPVNLKDVLLVRCSKCKFEGVLSPAYFRKQNKWRESQTHNRPKNRIKH